MDCCSKQKRPLKRSSEFFWKFSTFLLLGFSVLLLLFDMGGFLELSPEKGVAPLVQAEEVLPSDGIELTMVWGDLGKQLIDAGVINAEKFEALYVQRGGLSDEQKSLLYGMDNGSIRVDAANANFVLNLFWALGLANDNVILTEGPMQSYGGDPSRFASTGGWSLSSGMPMDHYSMHKLIVLTPKQQELVESVSKNIFRPCCGNSTYFPDCNHGMAMLGFLELLASQGASESEMYDQALALNSFWFPDTYLNIAQYFQNQGTQWNKVSAKEALGVEVSSGSGYQNVLTSVQPRSGGSGGGCGV